MTTARVAPIANVDVSFFEVSWQDESWVVYDSVPAGLKLGELGCPRVVGVYVLNVRQGFVVVVFERLCVYRVEEFVQHILRAIIVLFSEAS